MSNLTIISIGIWAVLAFGCEQDTPFTNTSTTETGKSLDWPEEEIGEEESDGMFTGFDTDGKEVVASEKVSNRIWLNFEGADVLNKESAVLKNISMDQVNIPPFAVADLGETYKDQDRNTIITQITDFVHQRFDGINVEISLTQPEKRPYTTVHVGGLNFTALTQISGIAPLDIGNFHGNDIAFVFSQSVVDDPEADKLETVANLIAHELGHSFGTRHIENESAIMNPIVFTSSNDFDQTGPYPEGEGEENSREILMLNLGRVGQAETSTTPPNVEAIDLARSGDVIQFNVYSIDNIEANPDHNLGAFEYTWVYRDHEVKGHGVRILFSDDELRKLILKVKGLKKDKETETIHEYLVQRPEEEQEENPEEPQSE